MVVVKEGTWLPKNSHNALISRRKLNPITDSESTNEGRSFETNPSSVAQLFLELLAEKGQFIAQK